MEQQGKEQQRDWKRKEKAKKRKVREMQEMLFEVMKMSWGNQLPYELKSCQIYSTNSCGEPAVT